MITTQGFKTYEEADTFRKFVGGENTLDIIELVDNMWTPYKNIMAYCLMDKERFPLAMKKEPSITKVVEDSEVICRRA